MSTVRVSCRQVSPRIADLAANADTSTEAVRSAVAEGADVIVLPELVTSGYMFESRAEVAAVAVSADHSLFAGWAAALAGRPGAIVIGGFAEVGAGGEHYNSAAVVDSSGIVSIYRKTHLWDREKLWFRPGSRLPPVIDTAHGRLGVAICYDLEFPELMRHLAVAGAELVAVPANWPLVPRPAGERPPEVVIAMAAARINRMAIACCDRLGTERGQVWTGGTTVVDVDGWPVATAGESGVATADLDLVAARVKTLTEHAHAFDDRRTDLYGGG